MRLEQLFPFPDAAVTKAIGTYPNAKKFVWVQEEPRNMGAYRFAQAQLKALCSIDVGYIGRPGSASPAVGSAKQHAIEQDKILTEAIGLTPATKINPSGGALAANPMFSTGLERIGFAARHIFDGSAQRVLAHATQGPVLQQNLVAVLEGR